MLQYVLMVKLNKIAEEGFKKCKELSSAKCDWASWILGDHLIHVHRAAPSARPKQGAVAEDIKLGVVFFAIFKLGAPQLIAFLDLSQFFYF